VKIADIGSKLLLNCRTTVPPASLRGVGFSMKGHDYIFHNVDLIFRIEVRYFITVVIFTAKLDWGE
jgi:hypothetical protein